MRAARDGSDYGRARLFILRLTLALTLGIMPAGCTGKDEQDTDTTKTAKTASEKVTRETANTKNAEGRGLCPCL